MKNKKELDKVAIILIIILALAFIVNYEEPTITGMSHKPGHDPPGQGGGGPPGGGGGGGGSGDSGTSTSTSGGSAGVQKVIGIYPQFPLNEQTIKNGEEIFKVKITYGGSPSSSAEVILESELFETTELKYTLGVTGNYDGNVTIKKKPNGKYRILYKVEYKEDEEGEILINLDPELRIDTEVKNNYSKGEKIKFTGVVKDFNGTLQENVEVKIKGLSLSGQLFEKTTSTINGQFSEEYLISHADPKGILNITIEAEDEYGNYGIKSFPSEIKQSGVEHFIVNFMSPLTDSEFKRSESIPITIQLKEQNNLVEGADVSLYTPQDEKIELKEVDKGTYSTNYIVDSNDPLGKVLLKIVASKEVKEGIVKVGGDSLPITFSPTEITFETSSPSRDIIYTNSRLKIETRLSYPDGSPVEGSYVVAELSNGEIIDLLEGKRGTYSGDYLITSDDRGALNLKITAEDINENVGSTELTLFVRKRSFIGNILSWSYENAIKRYLWAFITILIAATIFYRGDWEIKYLNYMLLRTTNKQKELGNLEAETEKKYYKEGSVTRKEFQKLKQDCEEKIMREREKEQSIRERLKKLKIS